MNRIVIVGNGFDLAHGLKSSYHDFVLWLINEAISKVYSDNNPVHTDFFSINPTKSLNSETFTLIESISEYYKDESILRTSNYLFFRINTDTNSNSSISEKHNITFCITSHLFDTLLKSKNWTDIEKAYFTILIKISEDKSGVYKETLKKLNHDFNKLKIKLAEYLVFVENKLKKPENKSLNDIIHKVDSDMLYKCYSTEIRNFLINKGGEGNPEKIFYINFNYTSVLRKVLENFSVKNNSIMNKIVSIHGNINDPEKIIFGYGDESNSHFRSLEELDIEAYLVNFKSNYYPSNSDYWDLEGILKLADYEVVVIGHSLGLSDRILFETIFENENCKFIHLTHTGNDSHFKKRIALSRHFKDKKKLRSKLVPESEVLKYDRISE
ncbi:MAG: AbiH family protein [Crocinitomicaceae bacterium]